MCDEMCCEMCEFLEFADDAGAIKVQIADMAKFKLPIHFGVSEIRELYMVYSIFGFLRNNQKYGYGQKPYINGLSITN